MITRFDLHQIHRAGQQQQRGEMVETKDGEYVAYEDVAHFLPPAEHTRNELVGRVAAAINGANLGWKIVTTKFRGGVPSEYTLDMTDGSEPRAFAGCDEAEEYAELRMLLCQAQAAIAAMNSFGLDQLAAVACSVEPALDAAWIADFAAWNLATFGPGPRTQGTIDHIRKELVEIERDPTDPAEWVDIILLGLNGLVRLDRSPNEIISLIRSKHTVNGTRQWPDWRETDPHKAIEHVKGGAE